MFYLCNMIKYDFFIKFNFLYYNFNVIFFKIEEIFIIFRMVKIYFCKFFV